jgi:putative RecB family exonuclease
MSVKINLSPSSVKMWLGCPYAYALDKVVKVPRWRRVIAPYMHTGRAVHTVVEHLAQAPELTAADAMRELDATFSWHVYTDRLEAEAAYEIARRRLSDWLAAPYGWGEGRILAIEKMLRSPLREGLVLWGKPDLVREAADGILEVVDHKSGQAIPTLEQLRQDPQATIYRILAAIQWPNYPEYRISFSYLATSEVIPVTCTTEEAEAWWDYFSSIADEIRRSLRRVESDLPLDEAFEPNPGKHCAYCTFRKVCTFQER